MVKNKDSKYYVPHSIQVLFVSVVGIFFVVQLGFMLHSFITQYLQNPYVGGFYGFMFTYQAVPVLLFAVAYVLNPRTLKVISRCFEAMIIAIAAGTAWTYINSISPTFFIGDGEDFIETYARNQIIAAVIFTLVFAGILLWLRKTKRWQ